ncbi:MAG: hypothetical protein LBP59_10495 [Planctomycetaceae bacterium]|nr:hypothetical protein [Planctomycetaceae bacterium]
MFSIIFFAELFMVLVSRGNRLAGGISCGNPVAGVRSNVNRMLNELLTVTECTWRTSQQVKRWRKQLQALSDKYGETVVRQVIDWYKLNNKRVHNSPQQFIEWFRVILHEYKLSVNPYSSERLRPVMNYLQRFIWDCDFAELELAVGRSLYVVNDVQSKLLGCGVELDTGLTKYVLGQIGASESFVQFHFESGFGLSVKRLEITQLEMRKYLVKWSNQYGVSPEKLLRFIYGKC